MGAYLRSLWQHMDQPQGQHPGEVPAVPGEIGEGEIKMGTPEEWNTIVRFPRWKHIS